MSRFRKICIGIIAVIYLFGVFPPFMSLYNRPGFILGMPTFIFGLLIFALSMLLVTYILYRHEYKDIDEE